MANTTPAPADEFVDGAFADLAKAWGLVVVWGVLTIALGVMLLAWPKATLLVVALLLGIWLIITGAIQMVGAFAPGLPGSARALFLISAVLSLVIGVILVSGIIDPSVGAARSLSLLSLLIGAGWLVEGVSELVGALGSKDMPGRGWSIAMGLLGIIAAIVVLAWPLSSLVVLAVVTGICLVVIGGFRIAAGLALRSRTKALAA